MELITEKKQLRQAMKTRLAALYTGAVREEQSLLLRRMLRTYWGDKSDLRVAIYAPLTHEVNLMPLLEEAPQHRYFFPRCYPAGRMEFYQITQPEQELETSRMGFKEPRESCTVLASEELDCVIVPGLAFTRDGGRLGYGGGFYDRYLLRCPQAEAIALCFAQQILSELPSEAHDARIAHIMTTC